jgi:hypothetical protein
MPDKILVQVIIGLIINQFVWVTLHVLTGDVWPQLETLHDVSALKSLFNGLILFMVVVFGWVIPKSDL